MTRSITIGARSRTVPVRPACASPRAVTGTCVWAPIGRPTRLAGSVSTPTACNRSRNARHSRAFRCPVARVQPSNSQTVQANSSRLSPANWPTTDLIRSSSSALTSCPTKFHAPSPTGALLGTSGYRNRDLLSSPFKNKSGMLPLDTTRHSLYLGSHRVLSCGAGRLGIEGRSDLDSLQRAV